MSNNLNNGYIKYKFKRILLDKDLNDKYLHCHNDVLALLKTWNGSTNQNRKHLLLRSHYPWLFSSRNEIKNNEDLQQHRILPIIALSEIGRKSLTALKNVILHDKYAHVIELLSIKGHVRKWSKSLSNVATSSKPFPCLVHGVNIMMKKKIMYYSGCDDNNNNNSDLNSSTSRPSFIDFADILQSMYANDDIRIYTYYLQLLAYYKLTHNDMEKRLCHVNSIQFIRSICEIVLGNNRKIISYLQGKESAVRTAVPKRVPSCRAQICLAPHLRPTQIGLPYWWAKYCNFVHKSRHEELIICETDESYEVMPERYLYTLNGQRIIAKRDPIIHILAFCIYDQVYFHRDSRCKVGIESLKKTASDFDGDTWILYFTDDLRVMHEIDYNASPRFSMALHGQCRINPIESIVLAMYRRDVTAKIKHWQLYDFVRRRSIYKWLMNSRNCMTLELISKMGQFSPARLYNMIEPTEDILNSMLLIIYTLYGSRESYDWYCEILRLTVQLSLQYKGAVLYQPDLPCDYTLTNNLLNFNLLAASFSCAKGNIHTYKSMLDKVYEKDKHTLLSRKCEKGYDNDNNTIVDDEDEFDYDKLIADITNANIFAAKKSKQVPQQGYNLFKDTIEGDLMSFGGNNLNYGNQVLIKDIYMHIPMQYIMDSSVAYTILYSN